MQERGSQSRRMRQGPPDRVRRPAQPSDPGRPPGRSSRSDTLRIWQVLAIVAIIAATAGWTAAIVLAMRPAEIAAANPSDDTARSSDGTDSLAPVELTHVFPDLEAVLPTSVSGTTLQTESWTGDAILADDGWSNAVTNYLKGKGLSPSDLQAAQSTDPDQNLDLVVRVFRAKGIAPNDLLQTMITGWKVDYPDLAVSQQEIGDKSITKGGFGAEGVDSYWYIRGDTVYDIETGDASIAAAALAAIPAPGASVAPPASGRASPAASAPAASPAASSAPSSS